MRPFEIIGRGLALLLAALLGACATLPADYAERSPRQASQSRVAPVDAPLVQIAALAGATGELSAVRPLPQAAVALDARIELLRQAHDSIDLQTYHLADDKTGRLVLRELRDAARRGVRVRLLLDDWYNSGIDALLLGFAAQTKVELRLFNPFVIGRDGSLVRYAGLLHEFSRLNHRMHNKLMVVDGAVAIAGGRNLTDEYFLRSEAANFIDFELLLTGPIVAQLASSFDSYWNGPDSLPIALVPGIDAGHPPDAEVRRQIFDAQLAREPTPPLEPPPERDVFGRAPLGQEIASRRFPYLTGRAGAFSDAPEKRRDPSANELIAERYLRLIGTAKQELTLVSPYFVPGADALAVLRKLRERGVAVRVITNSTATSDEPLVGVAHARYRAEMLRAGIRLFEVASQRLHADSRLRRLLGRSVGRLHAKMAIVDRELVLVGSMNADPRSARLNTELGVAVRSAELSKAIHDAYEIDLEGGVYEVRFGDDGRTLEWVGRDSHGQTERHLSPPGLGWWDGLRLFLLGLLVPEWLL